MSSSSTLGTRTHCFSVHYNTFPFHNVQVTGPEASVFFLDYGNTDTVSVRHVKALKEEFRGHPAQAMNCGLNGVAPSAEWTEDASAAFEDMVMEHEYTATVMKKSAGR